MENRENWRPWGKYIKDRREVNKERRIEGKDIEKRKKIMEGKKNGGRIKMSIGE